MWTYDNSLSTARDKVRFLCGDYDPDNKLFDDGEVDGMLSMQNNDVYRAAAGLANSLASKYAGITSISVDGLSISGSDKAAQYRTLAASLLEQGSQAAGGLGAPFVGGVSKGTMDGVDADTDRFPSKFKVSQFDFTGDAPNVERNQNSG